MLAISSVGIAIRASKYVKVGTPCDKISAIQKLFRGQLQRGDIPLNKTMSTAQIRDAYIIAVKNAARGN